MFNDKGKLVGIMAPSMGKNSMISNALSFVIPLQSNWERLRNIVDPDSHKCIPKTIREPDINITRCSFKNAIQHLVSCCNALV